MTRNETNSQGPSAGRKRRTKNPPDFTGQLAKQAIVIAIRGAKEYLSAHKLTADTDALTECVKAHAKAKVGEALDDAKEAFDCNMIDAGVATFTATMFGAGIAAAKEAVSPVFAMILRAKKAAKDAGVRMACSSGNSRRGRPRVGAGGLYTSTSGTSESAGLIWTGGA
jgi:hypothetical protein